MGEMKPSSPPVAPASYPSPQQISPHLTLQPPLSRRGNGPGLILALDHYALIEESEKHLDPPPLQKWAEEGFAVVQLLVPGKVEDGGEFPLDKALEALKGCEGCDFGKGVGVVCESRTFIEPVVEEWYLKERAGSTAGNVTRHDCHKNKTNAFPSLHLTAPLLCRGRRNSAPRDPRRGILRRPPTVHSPRILDRPPTSTRSCRWSQSCTSRIPSTDSGSGTHKIIANFNAPRWYCENFPLRRCHQRY